MAGSTYLVSTKAELDAALQSADGGDIIKLNAGDYGNLYLNQYTFTSTVTITSADPTDPAIFNSVKLYGCSNLTFDTVTVDFQPTATTVEWDAAIRMDNSSDISITNSVIVGGDSIGGIDPDAAAGTQTNYGIQGYPIGYGVHINWSQNVTIDNCDISEFNKGVMVNSVDGLSVLNSEFHDLRTIGVSGGDASDVTIIDNHFTDFTPWKYGTLGDHGDVIHFWTTANQTSPNDNYVISGNFLEQGSGEPIMGIYLDDDGRGIGYTDVTIEDNVLHLGHLHGILIEHGDGVVIDDNTLVQSSGTATWAPKIYLTAGTQNVLITDNILTEIGIAGPSYSDPSANNIVTQNNLFAQVHDPSKANYIGDLLVNGMTSDGDVTDFAPIAGTAADGLGPTYLLSGSSTAPTSTSPTTTQPSTTDPTTTVDPGSTTDPVNSTDPTNSTDPGSVTDPSGTTDPDSGSVSDPTAPDGSGSTDPATTSSSDGDGDGSTKSGKGDGSKGSKQDEDEGNFISEFFENFFSIFTNLFGSGSEDEDTAQSSKAVPAHTAREADVSIEQVVPITGTIEENGDVGLTDEDEDDLESLEAA